MVDRTNKPAMKRINWADQVAKGNYTIGLCNPVGDIIRHNICEPDFEEDYHICRPFIDKFICTPSVWLDKAPGLCGIYCRIRGPDDIREDIRHDIRIEMEKHYEKNLEQFADIKKEVDVKANAILKEVKAQK